MQNEWKQEIPRKLFLHFCLWFQKRIVPEKYGLTREQNLLENFKNYAKLKKTQTYFILSETKAAFAERTIRSLKNILYRYMEDNGYKYIHKLTQFVTTLNSRRNCSIDLIPKNVKKSDFCPFCTANNYEKLREPSLKLEIEFASRSMIYHSGRVISHSLQKRFSKLWQFLPKNLQYTQKRMNKMRLSAVNFIRKSWSKSFNNGIVHKKLVSNASAQRFPDNTLSSLINFLPEQMNLDGQLEVATSEKSYPSRYQNITEGKFMFFDKKLSKSSKFYYLEPGLYLSITDIVEAMNTLFQERHNHTENFITVKVSRRTQKVEIYFATEGSGLAFFSTDLGHIFGSNGGNDFGVMWRGKGPHKPELAYDIVRIHSFMIYTNLIQYNIVGDTKIPLLQCILCISRLKAGEIITTGQYMNYQTFSNL